MVSHFKARSDYESSFAQQHYRVRTAYSYVFFVGCTYIHTSKFTTSRCVSAAAQREVGTWARQILRHRLVHSAARPGAIVCDLWPFLRVIYALYALNQTKSSKLQVPEPRERNRRRVLYVVVPTLKTQSRELVVGDKQHNEQSWSAFVLRTSRISRKSFTAESSVTSIPPAGMPPR